MEPLPTSLCRPRSARKAARQNLREHGRKGNKAQRARASALGTGSTPGTEGREGGPGQPLKALCEQMLGLQLTLASVPTKSAEGAKLQTSARVKMEGKQEEGGTTGGQNALDRGHFCQSLALVHSCDFETH